MYLCFCMADSNGLESFLRPGEVDTMHEPVTLRCQWLQPSITRLSSPHSGRAELPASTVRAHAHLRNHLRHHEPRSRATQTGLSNVLFALVSASRRSVCAVTVMAAAAATACQSMVFTAPGQGKAETLVVCDQTCLSLFCLPR